MLIKIENTYHNTTEVVEANSLKEATESYICGLQITAENLAENEIEEDWSQYYNSYEKAFDVTYEGILDQLKSEVVYIVIG
ncbi:TPA: hypothetical protein IX023_002655 [Enterococcus faecium]|nr:hypothetical protein [Enterococcus faecium]